MKMIASLVIEIHSGMEIQLNMVATVMVNKASARISLVLSASIEYELLSMAVTKFN